MSGCRWPLVSGSLRFAVPGRITVALEDRAGPEVDVACGVSEPVVDLWERGVLLPQAWHVRRLAALTGHPVGWFYERGPLPEGRVMICSSRKPRLTVVESGEVAAPVCPDCGMSCWMRMPSKDGPVLIEQPDPAYGSWIVCVLRKGSRGRPLVWGVRPAGPGDRVEGHLLRRPHTCPTFTVVCTAVLPDGSECGELARPYPGGPRCQAHPPVARFVG